jgi:polysaccharide export outer membrane protein
MLALPLAAQTQPAAQTQVVITSGEAHALKIASGDLLDVGVFDTPELSGRLRVDERGVIEIPIAGEVRVTGMSADEAAKAIENKLRSADILKDPHVSVLISEYATQGVTVTGEVKTPGIYPLLGSHGLVDLLSAAGGVSSSAGRLVSVTHKSDPDHPEMVKLDARPGHLIANVDIQPGDTVVVSHAGVCYIVGEVNKPGGFLIEGNDRLTVLQVVALAGGGTHTSAPDQARLIRKTANGREEIPAPLKSMMRGKVVDMALEDGDILFIPSSKGKIFAYRGIDTAVSLATGLTLAGRL